MKHIVQLNVGGRDISIETGWLAKQAAGAVLVRENHSAVFVAVTTAAPRPGIDFFPLTVDYREKTSAAGKLPGGFFKRESRPTQKEILTSRVTDRPLRPQFPEGYNDEVQIQGMVMSADPELDPDVLMINGSSAALMLSGVPFHGPVGAVRMGMVDGQFIVNPTYEQADKGQLNMMVAGTQDGICMVEAGANELSEEQIVEALRIAHDEIRRLCALQLDLCAKAGVVREEYTPPKGHDPALLKEVTTRYYPAYYAAMKTPGKHERSEALDDIKHQAIVEMCPVSETTPPEERARLAAKAKAISAIVGEFKYKALREMIKREGRRVDGRDFTTVRPITIEMSPFPRNHGSVTFTRGETQAFVTCTLGTSEDSQLIDGLRESKEEQFLLHYNFPSFSTGECKPIRGPGRREIGHGALAERALRPMLPDLSKFPYTIRIVSDILESNGSSSMASVCGGSLAMFDAGVPVKKAVAGVAMGLVDFNVDDPADNGYAVLTDILGDEDHVGDMDFKVCGTDTGITALQMDIKVKKLNLEVMLKALQQARAGRLHILSKMNQAMPAPRRDLSKWAPRYETVKIDKEQIGMLIGPGGKNIRALQEATKSVISVEEDGTVKIFSTEATGAKDAADKIRGMMTKPEVGQRVTGRVTSMREFGAFVEFGVGQEALVHVSQLSDGYVEKPEDVVKVGDEIEVEIINVDPTGKVKASRKAVILKDRGEEYTPELGRGGGGGRDRGGRGGGRREHSRRD
ncbi:MAG: polyribonucleotide nucleotidyltransferase [Planctomycetota bacterium]|nr:MAG: polyribonucleotide nucleotidyltransferase [Planctomycetota bacterium]